MCWVALDRVILLAQQLGVTDHIEKWSQVRAEIRDTILQRGWNDRVGS